MDANDPIENQITRWNRRDKDRFFGGLRAVPHCGANMRRLFLAALLALGSATAVAEAPPSATKGYADREATLQTAPRGVDLTPDNLLWLRWRAPGAFIGGLDQRNAFATAYDPVAGLGPVGFGLEPGIGLSPLIPTIGLFGPRDPFQLQAGVLETSLGHGTLVADFTSAPLGMPRAPGLALEGRLAGVGAELMVADLLAPDRLVAARGHVRPILLALRPDAGLLQADAVGADPATEVLGALVLGASFAVDSDAPGSRTGEVSALGVDAALRVLDLRELALGARVDFNTLAGAGGGAGVGAHGGLNADLRLAGVGLRADLEAWSGTSGYLPRYFDRLYLLERDGVLGDARPKAAIPLAASVGGRARLGLDVLGLVQARLEVDDRVSELGRDGRVSLGVHTMVPLALMSVGGGLTLAQTDMNAFARGDLFAPGFVLLGEARLASLLDVVHVTTQLWTVHRPFSATTTAWEIGGKLGLELRFGLL
jgi:hypothetical protein